MRGIGGRNDGASDDTSKALQSVKPNDSLGGGEKGGQMDTRSDDMNKALQSASKPNDSL